MKKTVDKLISILEKYKHIDFDKIDRAYFDKIRKEEIANFDSINDEAILKVMAYLSSKINRSTLKTDFKIAIDKKAYAGVLIKIVDYYHDGVIDKKDKDYIDKVSQDFGKKMDKLNLDLLDDDKTLEQEGFFKKYTHLKK